LAAPLRRIGGTAPVEFDEHRFVIRERRLYAIQSTRLYSRYWPESADQTLRYRVVRRGQSFARWLIE
jgi:hypothetical protein